MQNKLNKQKAGTSTGTATAKMSWYCIKSDVSTAPGPGGLPFHLKLKQP